MSEIRKSVASHKAKLITITKWLAVAYAGYFLVINRFNVARWSLLDWFEAAIRVAIAAVVIYCITYWAIFCAVSAKEAVDNYKHPMVQFLIGVLYFILFFIGGPILLYLGFLYQTNQ